MVIQGNLFINSKSFPQAVNVFEKVIEINPTYQDAYSNMGYCFIELNNYDSAVALLEVAAGLGPYRPRTWYYLGLAHFKLNNFSLAEKHWLRSLNIDSSFFQPKVSLANLFKKTNQFEQQLKYLSQAAAYTNTPPNVLIELGNLYLRFSDYQNAAISFKRALNKGADSVFIENILINNPQLRQFWSKE